MVKDKSNFIKTSDFNTRKYLLDAGFQLLLESNGVSIFMNNANLTFGDVESQKLKITYSNILTF